MKDSDIIRHFIATGKGRHWFDRIAQKQHMLNIATTLFIEYDYEPLEAIKRAEEFTNCFFETVIAPGAQK